MNKRNGNRNKLVFLVFLLLPLFAACQTLVVKGSLETQITGSKVGLLPVEFSKRLLPVFPLMDAGLHNAAIPKSQIADQENNIAPKLTKIFADSLPEHIEAEIQILDDESLSARGEFDEIYIDRLTSYMEREGFSAVIVPYIRVETTKVSFFGINGANFVHMMVQVIGSDGSIYGEGEFKSEVAVLKPKDIIGYAALLMQAEILTPQLIDTMFG